MQKAFREIGAEGRDEEVLAEGHEQIVEEVEEDRSNEEMWRKYQQKVLQKAVRKYQHQKVLQKAVRNENVVLDSQLELKSMKV